ncbi:MAG: hypothetical protein PF480_06380 [Roseovarius sp.]|nr:hypothetical protein [Roseovarius sp.]
MSKLIHIGRLALLALALFLCAPPQFASAGQDDSARPSQTTGLMWNRTGLPAVFPLQVKTPAGQDYFLTLIDEKTGEDALAAYIVGGAFFKVLVPPGVFRLRFAVGDVWQGEDRLFGSSESTRFFELKAPLTFEIRNLATKAGHLVNISDLKPGQIVDAAVKDQLICQSLRTGFPSQIQPSLKEELARDGGRRGWIKTRNGRLKYFDERLPDRNLTLKHHEYYLAVPQYVVRSRYCD